MQVLGESGNVETGHLRAPSVLNPGQAVEAPAVVFAALLPRVDLALEAFEHVEHMGEPGLGGRLGRQHRALAAADRKSTRLNSSHLVISYAVFCLKKTRTT